MNLDEMYLTEVESRVTYGEIKERENYNKLWSGRCYFFRILSAFMCLIKIMLVHMLKYEMKITLYDVGTNTVNYHIKKIFEDSELQDGSVIRKFRITAANRKSYSTNYY